MSCRVVDTGSVHGGLGLGSRVGFGRREADSCQCLFRAATATVTVTRD